MYSYLVCNFPMHYKESEENRSKILYNDRRSVSKGDTINRSCLSEPQGVLLNNQNCGHISAVDKDRSLDVSKVFFSFGLFICLFGNNNGLVFDSTSQLV